MTQSRARPERGDWSLARARFAAAHEADPECYEASYWLGRILAKQGEWRQAIRMLAPLWNRTSQDPRVAPSWVALTLAWCYDYLGNRKRAVQWYTRVAAVPDLVGTLRDAVCVGLEGPQWPKVFPRIPEGLRELPAAGWSARSSHERISPSYAIDGKPNTCWTPAGEGQKPRHWLRLDLGAERPNVSGLWLDDDAGGQATSQNNTPRQCRIFVSREGERWTRVAEWRWSPNTYLAAWWEPISARYILLEQTAEHRPEWWTVFNVHVFARVA